MLSVRGKPSLWAVEKLGWEYRCGGKGELGVGRRKDCDWAFFE